MAFKKNILVAPLDWGLGHATRMIPVVKEIQSQGGNVIIAADNGPYHLLKKYFPDIKVIKLSGVSIKYPSNGSMAFAMLRSLPRILESTKESKTILNKIIIDENIDAIISDNRYELSSKHIPSIIVTHQLNIKTYGIQILAKPIIDLLINFQLKKFDEIWVPDESDNFLSGSLSQSNFLKQKTHYIGLLSRFSGITLKPENKQNEFDLLIILSGPEPQRTILENKLIKQVKKTRLRTVILRGKPESNKTTVLDNIELISHVSDEKFIELINASTSIVCRPGYSTLMDFAFIQKKIITIPTPGQTEQIYLAKRLKETGVIYSEKQKAFDLENAIQNNCNYEGFKNVSISTNLSNRIYHLLNNC